MPIYEYRCDNCGHEFETIQKVSESPLKTCPACEKDALKKKVSAAAFRLKGGGWYETDFKSDKKRNVAGEEKAAAESGKDDGAKKSENGGASKTSEGAAKPSSGGSGGESKGGGASGSAAGSNGSKSSD